MGTRLLIVACISIAAGGCASGVTPVAIVAGDESLAADRDVVLRCTADHATARRNYTFGDQYLAPTPAWPGGGMVYDLPLRVESVVRGRYAGTTLRIADAQGADDRGPTAMYGGRGGPPAASLRGLYPGEPVVVAFNRNVFGARSDFILVRRAPTGP